MLKNILNLKGARELNREEQKSVNGGAPQCNTGCPWRPGLDCWWCVD